MKIIQVSSGDFFSTYGGGQVYVKNLVDEMIREQCEVVVFSFVNTPTSIEKKDYRGIELYEIGILGIGELSQLFASLLPNIIHAHSQKEIITRIGKELGIPVIVTAHHGGILCPAGALMNDRDEICQTTIEHRNCLRCCLRNIRSGVYAYPFVKHLPKSIYLTAGKLLEKKKFIPFITPIGQTALHIKKKQEEWESIKRNCSILIAPSYAIAEAMIRNGAPEKKIAIIPHGIPLPKVIATQPTVVTGIKFFFVGRICYIKGIHILLKAFNEIESQSTELHLIGGSGNKVEERYMKKLQKEYVHNKQIIWHGKVEPKNVLKIINNYHVLIHPSICLEIFGLNISEALSMGKWVLATRCGGAEMQIEEGVNGWLVEPNNPTSLKMKLKEIVTNFKSKQLHTFKTISIEEHCKTLIKTYTVNLIQ